MTHAFLLRPHCPDGTHQAPSSFPQDFRSAAPSTPPPSRALWDPLLHLLQLPDNLLAAEFPTQPGCKLPEGRGSVKLLSCLPLLSRSAAGNRKSSINA